MDRKAVNYESHSIRSESVVQHVNEACSRETSQAPPTEMRISANNLNITLKFAEKPNGLIQESVLRVLVNSYKARVIPQ